MFSAERRLRFPRSSATSLLPELYSAAATLAVAFVQQLEEIDLLYVARGRNGAVDNTLPLLRPSRAD